MSRIAIVGGGPAGAAAAIALARAGRAVTLFERTTGAHDKVCGDFFSGEAASAARALGVDAAALGATPITHVRLHHRGRTAEARLPFPAFGFSRRTLDEALLGRAAAAGVDVRRGTSVRMVDPQADAIRMDGETFARAMVATGKHQVRGAPRDVTPGRAIGWKMRLRLSPVQHAALSGAIELFPLAGGYAGLNATEGGGASLCAVLPASWAGDFPAVAARLSAADPVLAGRLAGAQPLLERPLTIAGLAYGKVQRRAAHPMMYRLGDQAAQIASVTGDGVAIALHTAAMASAAILRGEDADAYTAHMRHAFRPQLHMAEMFRAALRWPELSVAVCRAVPSVMTLAAAATRVPKQVRTRG